MYASNANPNNGLKNKRLNLINVSMNNLNWPVSLANVATILSRHWRQTVWEQGNNFGVCSPPSYMPENVQNWHFKFSHFNRIWTQILSTFRYLKEVQRMQKIPRNSSLRARNRTVFKPSKRRRKYLQHK